MEILDSEKRRARNLIWNAAADYSFEPDFKAYDEDGRADLYWNSIIGAVRKNYGAETIEGLFEALHGCAREQLFEQLQNISEAKVLPIVTTDAVYRQTFYKEQLWREKGAVAVDMETSALWSVGKFLGLQVASVLMISDRHPLREGDPTWEWKMTMEMRWRLFQRVMEIVFSA